MTILAIYCHLQGREVTELLRPLVERGFEFEFAPLGLEVGGQKWWDATMAAIDRAEAAIVYVTPEALADPTVEQRSQLFYDTRKPLFPMARPHFDPALVPRSSILHRLQRFAVGDGDDLIWRRVEQDLLMFVSRRLRCFLSYSRLDAVLASRLAFDLRAQGRSLAR